MRNLTHRIGKLEQLTVASKEEGLLFTVLRVDIELALDNDTCVETLRECGYVPTGCGLSVLASCVSQMV